ncbi:MAG TPA: GFA family protein [Polyangiaceae bacterium]
MQKVTCPCGAVELTIEGKPLAEFYCHCDDCRKMTSGAYAAESVHREGEVTVTRGQTKVWTLKRNPRRFCAECGGRLFIEVAAQKLRGVNGLLLAEGEFQPKFHVNCHFAVLPVKDGLPHFARMPASFGGSDDKVDW